MATIAWDGQQEHSSAHDETSAYNRSSSSVWILIGSQLLNSLGFPSSIHPEHYVSCPHRRANRWCSLARPPRRRCSIGKPNKTSRTGDLDGERIVQQGSLRDLPLRAISFLAGTGGLSRGLLRISLDVFGGAPAGTACSSTRMSRGDPIHHFHVGHDPHACRP